MGMRNDGFEHTCRTGNRSPWPPHATHAWRLQAAQVLHVRSTPLQAHAEGACALTPTSAHTRRRLRACLYEARAYAPCAPADNEALSDSDSRPQEKRTPMGAPYTFTRRRTCHQPRPQDPMKLTEAALDRAWNTPTPSRSSLHACIASAMESALQLPRCRAASAAQPTCWRCRGPGTPPRSRLPAACWPAPQRPRALAGSSQAETTPGA